MVWKGLTTEKFIEMFEDKHKGYKILSGKFENRKSWFTVKCLECGYEWETQAQTLILDSFKCRKCKYKVKWNKEYAQKLLDEKYPNSYKVLEYKNKKVIVQHSCGYIRESWIHHILKGSSICPKCSKRERLTYETFIEKVYEIWGDDITVLDKEYKGTDSKVKVRCNICGNIWYSSPHRLILAEQGCPNLCVYNREYRDKFIEDLKKKYGDKFELEFSSDIKERYVKIRCKECGTEIERLVNALYNKNVYCKTCNLIRSSELEIELGDCIKNIYSGKIERGKVFNFYEKGFSNELDIYIPEFKLGIEFDGLYYHSESMGAKNKQRVKKDNFKKYFGINVIFVREDEFLHKKDIVLSRISNKIRVTENRIYARNLKVYSIPTKVKNEFLNKYHIQGSDNSNICFGLVKDNKLYSVMTFSKVRFFAKSKIDNENTYELVRFASRINTNIVGGFSKLLKYAEKKLKDIGCDKIKTFGDRRYTDDDNNVYSKNGFYLYNISNPNYVYFKGRDEIYSRVKFQKSNLKYLLDNFDESLSEYENMINNGYDRYWDCGNLVYYKDI